MKVSMLELQVKCDKLQVQMEQFQKGEKDAMTKLGNLRAEMMKQQRTATSGAKGGGEESGDGGGGGGGGIVGGVDEEEVQKRVRDAVDQALANEQQIIRRLEGELSSARQQQVAAAQAAASEAKGADAKQHAQAVATLAEQVRRYIQVGGQTNDMYAYIDTYMVHCVGWYAVCDCTDDACGCAR